VLQSALLVGLLLAVLIIDSLAHLQAALLVQAQVT
jgi:hypothetical protein